MQSDPVTTTQPISKPQRSDFYFHKVMASNGTIVDEKDWRAQLPEGITEFGRDMQKALKRVGMQLVRGFDREGYNSAKTAHRIAAREAAKASKKDLISLAFQEAGVPHHPRVESMLRTSLPCFRGVSEKKALAGMKQIVKAMANHAILTPKTAQNDASVDGEGASASNETELQAA